jgi:hypothetical protein
MLTEAVNELLRPLRQRRAALADDHSYLESVLDIGNDRARQIADHTLMSVHDMLGMTYANRRDSRRPRSATARWCRLLHDRYGFQGSTCGSRAASNYCMIDLKG